MLIYTIFCYDGILETYLRFLEVDIGIENLSFEMFPTIKNIYLTLSTLLADLRQ